MYISAEDVKHTTSIDIHDFAVSFAPYFAENPEDQEEVDVLDASA